MQSHYSIQCVKSLYSTVPNHSTAVFSHTTPYTVIQVTLQHIQHDNSLYSSGKLLYSIHIASTHPTAQGVHHLQHIQHTQCMQSLYSTGCSSPYSVHLASSHSTAQGVQHLTAYTVPLLYSSVLDHSTAYTVHVVTLQHWVCITLQHTHCIQSLYSTVRATPYSIHSASTLQQCARSFYSTHSACSHHTTNTILLVCYECLRTWPCVPSRMTEQWLGGSISY